MAKTSRKNVKLKVRDLSGNLIVSGYRCLTLGIQNFIRNKFLSIATIVVISVIIFIFNIILAVQFIGSQTLRALNEKVDIVIYLRSDVDNYNATQMVDAIKQISGVKEVKYTSKEDALEIIAKTHPKTAEFLQKFDIQNPLPPSISIVTQSAEDHLAVQKYLQTSEYRNLMQNYVTDESSGQSEIMSTIAKNLASISSFVKQLIFWIVLIFVLGGTLVIVNAIQLTIFTRRHEIYIMRLVGATPSFIRTPFIFEGIMYGVIAVILSFIFLSILGNTIHIEGSNLWAIYQNIDLLKIFLIELGLTVLLAGFSSYGATEQYIKGKLTVN